MEHPQFKPLTVDEWRDVTKIENDAALYNMPTSLRLTYMRHRAFIDFVFRQKIKALQMIHRLRNSACKTSRH